MMLLLQETVAPELEQISGLSDVIRWGGVLASIFTVLGAWLLLRLVDGALARLGAAMVVWRMFLKQVRAIFHFLIYLTAAAAVMMLSFRLSGPMLTFLGGTAAVALGFAFKDLVASLVGGITIMVDRPFQVGDRASFGGYYGDITAIGLRSVRMQTLDDNTVTIPNLKFFTDITSCGNYGELDMMVVVDFYIGADQDVRRARELVREAAVTCRYVYLDKPVRVVAEETVLGRFIAVRLRLKAYVFDLRQEKEMATDITLRVLDAFRSHGIEPTRTLDPSVGSDKLPEAADLGAEG